MIKFLKRICFILLTVLSACGGTTNNEIPDHVPDAKEAGVKSLNITIQRFEKDLFAIKKETFQADTHRLFEKYGTFLTLFSVRVIKTGSPQIPQFRENLLGFLNDPTIREVFTEVEKKFTDISSLSTGMNEALNRFHILFPDSVVPAVYTVVTGFNYNIVTADSSIGIGLDMYLGEKSKYYVYLGLPEYKVKNMRQDMIVPDAVRGMLLSSFEMKSDREDLITFMIYHGKIIYLAQQLLLNEKEERLLGYTGDEINWCKRDEGKIWAHFVDKKLFYSNDFKDQINYINDGPFTPGFQEESPARLGVWLGLQIVKSYMAKNQGADLRQLILNQDAHEIFNKSGYKPIRL